jgi:hypothetical protein
MLSHREAHSTTETPLCLKRLTGNGDDPRERTVTRRGGLLERPAILNRSMPLIEGSAMSIPADLSMRYAIYTFEKQYT